MKFKTFFKILFMVFLPILLVSCFNYQDINKVSFSTSIIFDIDDFGRTIVYVDCIKPYRSTNEGSDKGKRIIYRGIGKTALEALKDINLASSYELNYSQNRAYIFTEKAAKEGIKKFTDLINNNQEFQIKPDLFVYYGDIDNLLKTTSSDEEYLGLYLEELVHKNNKNPKAMQANINDYFSNETDSNNTFIVGSIEIIEDALDKKIEIGGGSVIMDGKLVDRIDSREAMSYNLLMNKVHKGTLEISNPEDENKFITLEILGNNTNSNLIYDNNKITLQKNVSINVVIADMQGKAIIDNELLDYIKLTKEKQLEAYLKHSFEKYKNQGIDVFNIERLLEINYPNESIDNPISITDIDVKVDIIIEGTGIIKDSL